MTSEAMMVICTMIRMLRGRCRRIRLIEALESIRTTVSSRLMTSAVARVVVTASAEQMPRICSVTGLLSISGSSSVLRAVSAIVHSRSDWILRRNGPKPSSPSQKRRRLVTPWPVRVAPDRPSTW